MQLSPNPPQSAARSFTRGRFVVALCVVSMCVCVVVVLAMYIVVLLLCGVSYLRQTLANFRCGSAL